MKAYQALFQLNKTDRETLLRTSHATAGDLRKTVTKVLVAMSRAQDFEGEMKDHARAICGKDIKDDLQGIYEMVAVFNAVLDGKIEISELEFDAMDNSKIALLSPFLSKFPEKLAEATKLAKTGTAKQIRDLKPKAEKKDKDPEGETKEPAAPAAQGMPIQFAVLDMADPRNPLLTSGMVQNRIAADVATDPAYHAIFMLSFAAKVLRDHPEIAATVTSACGGVAAEIFDALTSNITPMPSAVPALEVEAEVAAVA